MAETITKKTRVSVGTTVLHRDGKKITVKDGYKFDFTQDEIDSVMAVNPFALRKLIDEAEDAPEAKVPAGDKPSLTNQVNTANASTKKAKGLAALADAEKALDRAASTDTEL